MSGLFKSGSNSDTIYEIEVPNDFDEIVLGQCFLAEVVGFDDVQEFI